MFSLGVGLTSNCNLHCAHWYRDQVHIHNLTLGEILKVCDSIEINSIGFGTGENGSNIDSGLDELNISLDAALPDGYLIIRSSNKFHRIVQNLRAFRKLQKNRRAVSPRLSIWFLGTTDSITELPDLLGLAADIEIEEVHLQRLVYFRDHEGYGVARREKTLRGFNDGALELIVNSRLLAKQLGIRFDASGLTNPLESVQTDSAVKRPWSSCYRPQTLMYITATAMFYPAVSLLFPPLTILRSSWAMSLNPHWRRCGRVLRLCTSENSVKPMSHRSAAGDAVHYGAYNYA